jgi:hypothetical protein
VLDLHTHAAAAREGRFGEYLVKLIRLVPARESNSQIAPKAYIATLIVSNE